MPPKTTKRGEVIPFKSLRRFSKLSDLEHKREYFKFKKDAPVRDRRMRGAEAGEDPDEQRAANVQGSILERIVYKHLLTLLGTEGWTWQYQYGARGARIFKGGYVLDFVIYSPRPIALEVQGAFWHGPETKWRDIARALSVVADGFEYEEILEWEVWAGDEYLEFRLRQLLGL